MRWGQRLCIVMLAGWLVAGCSISGLRNDQPDDAPAQQFATTGLAGEWDMSDGTLEKSIVLDCLGTGQYAWQDGRVVTTTVNGDYWAGTWNQPGNDRDGGFEVRLSEDRSQAEGRWWYSRIGEKHFPPGERSDTFTLMRPIDANETQNDCRRKAIHEALGPR